MTLRNYIALLTDPTEIVTIHACDPKTGKCIRKFTYFEEETLAEYLDSVKTGIAHVSEDEIEELAEEYLQFEKHLDSKIFRIDLLDRDIFVIARD